MLAVIRVILVFVYFILANIAILAICIARPFHRNNVYLSAQMYAVMGKLIGVKIEVRVPESLKKGGPYVYICNHQNSLDLITTCKAAQPGMVTVGKKELKWIPIFGQIYWLSGNVMINRGDKSKARSTLEYTAKILREKKLSVWFFPEGTRSYGRGLLPFKTGAFRLAKQTNEPIVLVSASTSQNKVKLNRWNNGTMLIELAEAQPLDDSRDIKQWAEYFREKMQKKIESLDKEVAQLEAKSQ